MSESMYEIASRYREFLENSDELSDDVIADTLEALDGEFEEKADATACYIKNRLGFADMIENEGHNLIERAKKIRGSAEKLKSYLLNHMLAVGKTRVETPRNMISVRKNPDKVVLDEPKFLSWAQTEQRVDLLTYKPAEPNKTAIKKALQDQADIPFAHLESGQSLQIK
ncbi:MAG: siphovirus Gp157 family protein [Lentisphaeria bacterium]|nr:siphovirus Gp157 family protein [Lentisphaeria bacterium]